MRLKFSVNALERVLPGNGRELAAAPRLAKQRHGGAVHRGERRERLPTFGAGHAEIDRVIGISA